ncbi:MAG: FmdB family zinc ribbon protein [Hyphomicrobiales bacterium]
MPLYSYECRKHGTFSDWRNMSECENSVPCPICGGPASRCVSAPYLSIDSGLRKAHRINEKSGEEPRVVRRRRGDPIPHDTHRDLSRHQASEDAHAHHHGGHSHSHDHGSGKAQVSNHPWMVRH